MKSFNEYILEQQDIDLGVILEAVKETSSNEERKKQLEKVLKKWEPEMQKADKLSNYVNVLNQMLDDPKAKALLEAGFGGELGNTQLSFGIKKLPVKTLRSTQGEIDISKSVDYALKYPEKNIDNYYSTGKNCVLVPANGFPLVTFRENYVIDGHHRWSQVYAFNPDAEMVCCDYGSKEIGAVQMLKAVQGTIAAVKADETNDNNGKLPQQKVNGLNLFDSSWTERKIINYVKKNASDKLVDYMKKYHEELDDINKVAKFVATNLMALKRNNYPEDSDINRGDMPQTDEAGTKAGDPKSALPNVKGSALNKLKDKEFRKQLVK